MHFWLEKRINVTLTRIHSTGGGSLDDFLISIWGSRNISTRESMKREVPAHAGTVRGFRANPVFGSHDMIFGPVQFSEGKQEIPCWH